MSLKLVYQAITGEFERAFKAIETPIARAATKTIDEAKTRVVTEGRSSIAAGGFGPKWQNTLRGNRYPRSGTSIDPAAWIYHKIPYAGVFETGAKIAGSPLLWLPLSTAPQKIGGLRMTPRNYIAQIGPLHTIRVPGRRPLLAGYMRGRPTTKPSLSNLRAGSALARLGVRRRRSDLGRVGVVSVPLFYGISSVQLRKHFDLTGVFNRVVKALPGEYVRNVTELTR